MTKQTKHKPNPKNQLTRERILDQAEALFASLMMDLKAGMPETTGANQMVLNACSIPAMVLDFNLARPLITRLMNSHDPADLDNRLIDHIVEFSLNGIGTGQEEVR